MHAWDLANAIKGTLADQSPKINLDTVFIQKYQDPKSRDCQNALQIKFRNSAGIIVVYYVDNGGLDDMGEYGRVFSEVERIDFQGNRPDARMDLNSTEGEVVFANNPL